MEENKQCDARLTSPAAFVEGGIQDACDDACSICLEPFSDSDPSTVTSFDFHVRFFRVVILRDLGNFSLLLQLTSCRHEFHLQCVLEWYVC